MNEKEFSEYLKDIMDKKKITQADLVRNTGISRSLISDYVNGKKSPALSNAIALAEAMGVTLDELSGRTDVSISPKEQTTSVTLKNNIKKLRLKNGVIQTVLADYLGITQNTLSNWEKGIHDIDNSSLQKIADYFHCSVDYVLGKEEKPAPTENPRHTAEELKKKAQEIQSGQKKRHIFAYGGTVEDSELVRKAKALERQQDHSRDDPYLLYQAKEQKTGGVLFGYVSGDWGHETLSEKEMEIVVTLIKSLRS